MAIEVNLERDERVIKGYVGFSWTTFFFGPFVPLFRMDWLGLIGMLVLAVITCGISNFVAGFIYNKIYTVRLLNSGWRPADEYSLKTLKERNYLATMSNGGFRAGSFGTINVNMTQNSKNQKTKKCIICGAELPEEAKFCSSCGKSQVKFCKYCNSELDGNSKYCSSCGKKLDD